MDKDSEYSALADQAERLSEQAPSQGIAESWRVIAGGFRQLAKLHAAAVQQWRRAAWDREDEAQHRGEKERPGGPGRSSRLLKDPLSDASGI